MIQLARRLEKEFALKGRDLSMKQGTPKYDVRNLNPEFKELFGFEVEKSYEHSTDFIYTQESEFGDVDSVKLPVYILNFSNEDQATLFALKWL